MITIRKEKKKPDLDPSNKERFKIGRTVKVRDAARRHGARLADFGPRIAKFVSSCNARTFSLSEHVVPEHRRGKYNLEVDGRKRRDPLNARTCEYA